MGCLRVACVRNNTSPYVKALSVGVTLSRQDKCGRAIRYGRRIGGRDCPAFAERRFQMRNLFGPRRFGLFVAIDVHVGAANLHGYLRDFLRKGTIALGLQRAGK